MKHWETVGFQTSKNFSEVKSSCQSSFGQFSASATQCADVLTGLVLTRQLYTENYTQHSTLHCPWHCTLQTILHTEHYTLYNTSHYTPHRTLHCALHCTLYSTRHTTLRIPLHTAHKTAHYSKVTSLFKGLYRKNPCKTFFSVWGLVPNLHCSQLWIGTFQLCPEF